MIDNEENEKSSPAPEQKTTRPPLPKVDVIQGMEGRDYMPDLLSLDTSTLDPEKHYRWVTKNKMRVARHRLLGYREVLSNTGVRLMSDGVLDDSADGLISVGDMVLMACSEASFRRRKRAEEAQATARISSVKGKFRKKARGVKGIRPLEEEE